MNIYAISDLHLGPKENKGHFSSSWKEHQPIIRKNWDSRIDDNSVVLMPGDFSWLQDPNDLIYDYYWISDRKGKIKVMSPGNHDYGVWTSYKEVSEFTKRYKSLYPLLGNAMRIENPHNGPGLVIAAVCGTSSMGDKYFDTNAGASSKNQEPERVRYMKELARCKLALAHAKTLQKENDQLIMMIHYPPFVNGTEESPYSQMIEEAEVDLCVYGHLHKEEQWKTTFQGQQNGVEYRFVATDFLGFAVTKIADWTEKGLEIYPVERKAQTVWKTKENTITTTNGQIFTSKSDKKTCKACKNDLIVDDIYHSINGGVVHGYGTYAQEDTCYKADLNIDINLEELKANIKEENKLYTFVINKSHMLAKKCLECEQNFKLGDYYHFVTLDNQSCMIHGQGKYGEINTCENKTKDIELTEIEFKNSNKPEKNTTTKIPIVNTTPTYNNSPAPIHTASPTSSSSIKAAYNNATKTDLKTQRVISGQNDMTIIINSFEAVKEKFEKSSYDNKTSFKITENYIKLNNANSNKPLLTRKCIECKQHLKEGEVIHWGREGLEDVIYHGYGSYNQKNTCPYIIESNSNTFRTQNTETAKKPEDNTNVIINNSIENKEKVESQILTPKEYFNQSIPSNFKSSWKMSESALKTLGKKSCVECKQEIKENEIYHFVKTNKGKELIHGLGKENETKTCPYILFNQEINNHIKETFINIKESVNNIKLKVDEENNKPFKNFVSNNSDKASDKTSVTESTAKKLLTGYKEVPHQYADESYIVEDEDLEWINDYPCNECGRKFELHEIYHWVQDDEKVIIIHGLGHPDEAGTCLYNKEANSVKSDDYKKLNTNSNTNNKDNDYHLKLLSSELENFNGKNYNGVETYELFDLATSLFLKNQINQEELDSIVENIVNKSELTFW